MTTPDFDDELLAEIENLRAEIDILRMAMLDGEQRNAELEAITTVAAAMNRSLELQEVVDVALESTLTALKLECGVLCLYDPSSRSFMPATDRQAPDEIIAALASFTLGSGPAGAVGESRSPLIIPNLAADADHRFDAALAAGLPFFAGIPVAADDELLGVMVLLDSKVGCISADWNIPLGRIGDLVGRAMANAQVLRRSKQEIVERMMGDQELRRLMARNQEKIRLVGQVLDALPFAVIVVGANGDELLSNSAADNAPEATVVNDDEGSVIAVAGVPLDQLRSRRSGDAAITVSSGGRELSLQVFPLSEGGGESADRPPLLITSCLTGDGEAALAAGSPRTSLPASETTVAALLEPLSTVLGVVELYAALAAAAAELPEPVGALVATVARQASEASGIVRKLMDAGERAPLIKRPLAVGNLLAELAQETGTELGAGIERSFHCDEDLSVNADPAAIRRMLRNLVDNACAAMSEGGELQVVAKLVVNDASDTSWQPPAPAGRWVEIRVTDSGHGIDEETLPRVFELFFSSHEQGPARGLGLAQARGLARQHGGHVALRSSPGQGTSAAVFLPVLVAASGDGGPAATPELVRGHGEAVMVVESDPVTRTAVARAVEELGYRALEATGTPEAMTIFHRFAGRIAVLLVEQLSEADTLSLLHELRRRYPRARAVQMTRQEIDAGTLQSQGWHDWVPRPPQLWELSLVLARAVSKD